MSVSTLNGTRTRKVYAETVGARNTRFLNDHFTYDQMLHFLPPTHLSSMFSENVQVRCLQTEGLQYGKRFSGSQRICEGTYTRSHDRISAVWRLYIILQHSCSL